MRRRSAAWLRLGGCGCAALALWTAPAVGWAQTERVSVAGDGRQAAGSSRAPDISADGRFVVFASNAANLAEGDHNGEFDVFVRDRRAGTTTRVSVSSEGVGGDSRSDSPWISADGRFVAFASSSSNLAEGASDNGQWDVFVRDRLTGRTELISTDRYAGDAWAHGISADGRFVLFRSRWSLDGGGLVDAALVRDRQREVTEFASDGLLAPRTPKGAPGYIYTDAPAISADGRFVSFFSTGVLPGAGPTCTEPSFFGPAFCTSRLYVRDRERGTVEALPADLGQSRSTWSADGRFLVTAGVVYDRELGATQRMPAQIPGEAAIRPGEALAISADGRFVAYQASFVDRPQPDASQVVLHDRQRGTLELLSENGAGEASNGWSPEIALSADGQFVAYASEANNLVAADTNAGRDVFVRALNPEHRGTPGAYAVFEKGGVELIARLGDPESFAALALQPPSAAPFHGSFQGARFAVIGSSFALPRADSAAPPRPSLLFSGSADPDSIGESAIEAAFAALAAPGGFFDSWSPLPSDGSASSGLLQSADPRSLSSALGELAFSDSPLPYFLAIRVDGQGRRTPIPGFSAAERPHQRDDALPLFVSEHGVIERVTEADLPLASELFAVISGGGWECIAHLGDQGELAARALEISVAACPNTFALGVADARLALVGVIDRDHPRANLLFSAPPSSAPLLEEAQVQAAFAELADAEQAGFIDRLPGLSAGAGSAVELAAADPRSYASRLSSGAPGAAFLPQLLVWPPGAAAAAVALHGAMAAPLLQAELLQRVELDAAAPGVIRFRAAP